MTTFPPHVPERGRLVVMSNRLPVTAGLTGSGRVALTDSHGGLASGMRQLHRKSGGLWIGWPGDVTALSPSQQADLSAGLLDRHLLPVLLSRESVERYYAGFSNRVLWPLFHYQIDRVPVDAAGWEAYREVNEAFAERAVREYRPGDRIWVHDYQLMLVPALIRARIPHASIGFFLHVPFPSSEVFRTLPWRRALLEGLLGADLLGFHTFAYMRHFIASLLHVSGVEADIDCVRVGDRNVKLGVFPMGIDAAQFAALGDDPDVRARVGDIRRDAGGRRIVLGVDRLDYTKGIPRRLAAVDRLLERESALADEIRYIQVAVPSRGEVDDYRRFKRQVEEAVGRINGVRGTLNSTPVHYIHRAVDQKELAALYCAADVMLVTPLRDGMNLVAKEFAASRGDETGVLVLSEFAGAVAELDGALVVNPYDVDEVSRQLNRALEMPVPEQHARMRSLRKRVFGYDVHAWAADFLGQLEKARPVCLGMAAVAEPPLAASLAAARRAGPIRLLLDYDGTLVPLARAPELAAPDEELLRVLAELAATDGVRIEIVSGRPREPLEDWFGHLGIPLWAEHGFWYRPATARAWHAASTIDPHWAAKVRPILDRFTAGTPGSRLEVKTASLAWHFRGSPHGFGARQAHELRMLLGDALSNQPLEVIEGHKVVEVRLRGISKSVVARDREQPAEKAMTVAIGDDRTDEELFRALPEGSLTIAVGQPLAGARHVLPGYRAVRQLLRGLVTHREGPRAAGAMRLAGEAYDAL